MTSINMARTKKVKVGKAEGKLTEADKVLLEQKAKVDNKEKDIAWQAKQVEATSDTKLEDDRGQGNPVVLRFFEFKSNPENFKKEPPTAQMLFNAHIKQIEKLLWMDGMTFEQAIEPRLMFAKDKSHYKFVIACRPAHGQTLLESTQTLSQIAHGKDGNQSGN